MRLRLTPAAALMLVALPLSVVTATPAAAQPAVPSTPKPASGSPASCAVPHAYQARPTAVAQASRTGGATSACLDLAAPRQGRAPKSGVHPNVVPAPDWCSTDGSWAFQRTGACTVTGGVLTVYRTDQYGTYVIGQIAFNTVKYEYTSADSYLVGWQVSMQPYAWWGEVLGSTVSGTASCSGACWVQGVNFPSQPFAVGELANGESFHQTTATYPGAVDTMTPSWTITARNPAWSNTPTLTLTAPEVRCDDATPGKDIGCVFANVTPVLTYSLSWPYPELARHIADAQGSGLPSLLTRLTDPGLIEANRATACPDSYPRPDGKSCDEYPFASTYQGAAFTGGGPRTFDWCQVDIGQPGSTGESGYSVCMIDADQNSGGGSALGSFYGDNRVIDHDAFYVSITG
jgi:hypothetical protein